MKFRYAEEAEKTRWLERLLVSEIKKRIAAEDELASERESAEIDLARETDAKQAAQRRLDEKNRAKEEAERRLSDETYKRKLAEKKKKFENCKFFAGF